MRFLEGKPIIARPVGAFEGGWRWRWCGRHPAIAGLSTAIVLVLLIGIASTTAFALIAERRAQQEQQAENTAKQAQAEAETSQEESEVLLYASQI